MIRETPFDSWTATNVAAEALPSWNRAGVRNHLFLRRATGGFRVASSFPSRSRLYGGGGGSSISEVSVLVALIALLRDPSPGFGFPLQTLQLGCCCNDDDRNTDFDGARSIPQTD